MKRIASNVAVRTLLFTMNPQSEVVILDCPSDRIPTSELTNLDSCSGGSILKVDEVLHNYEYSKVACSKICHTGVRAGLLFLHIDSSSDSY